MYKNRFKSYVNSSVKVHEMSIYDIGELNIYKIYFSYNVQT